MGAKRKANKLGWLLNKRINCRGYGVSNKGLQYFSRSHPQGD